MNYRILVATYTNDVVTLSFDSASGVLSTISSVTVGFQPSWITAYTKDSSIYFTSLEQSEGTIVAIKASDDGPYSVLGQVPCLGSIPCSLLVFEGELLVANYGNGTVVAVPITPESPYIATPKSRIEFEGSGPNTERQLTSHPHQVILHPDRKELLVPDLGSDKTWRLFKSSSGSWEVRGYVSYEPGGGPRHVAFYGDVLYTLLELTSTVVAHKFPPLPQEPTFIASSPTKTNPLPPNKMLAAEILIPTPNSSFPVPYLYVSNRNDPSPEGDSISIFSIADGGLELINEVPTGLNHVRGIEFGGPDSKWLIAGGVFSNGVKIFERVDGGKNLKEIASNMSVKSPTTFVWM